MRNFTLSIIYPRIVVIYRYFRIDISFFELGCSYTNTFLCMFSTSCGATGVFNRPPAFYALNCATVFNEVKPLPNLRFSLSVPLFLLTSRSNFLRNATISIVWCFLHHERCRIFDLLFITRQQHDVIFALLVIPLASYFTGK